MEIYKELYLKLFNGITDIIEEAKIEKNSINSNFIEKLEALQISTEEMYINSEE